MSARKSEIAARAALVCGASLVAIAMFEVALRGLGFRPTVLDPRMFVAVADSLMPYRLRAHYRGNYAGGSVTIDADGYRTVRPRLPVRLASASRSLLLLGDSQIFGAGLDDDLTIPSQLQDSAYARGISVRIRNIGVPGYSSWNEYRALALFLLGNRVDQVILLYHPSDPTFNNDFLGIGESNFDAPLRRAARFTFRHLHAAAFVRQTWLQIRRSRQLPSSSNPPAQAAIDYSMMAVRQASELCRERGIPFSVGLYRNVDALTAPARWYAYEAVLRDALTTAGVDWFIVDGHTANLAAREIMVSLLDQHAGSRASAFIVSDLLRHLKL